MHRRPAQQPTTPLHPLARRAFATARRGVLCHNIPGEDYNNAILSIVIAVQSDLAGADNAPLADLLRARAREEVRSLRPLYPRRRVTSAGRRIPVTYAPLESHPTVEADTPADPLVADASELIAELKRAIPAQYADGLNPRADDSPASPAERQLRCRAKAKVLAAVASDRILKAQVADFFESAC